MTVSTKISQTWLASQTGAIDACACSRIAAPARPRPAEHLPEAGAEVGAGEHGVGDQADEQTTSGSLGERQSTSRVLRQLERLARQPPQDPPTATTSPT